jgi:glucose-1-phosphate adenylyltransferase
VEKPAQPKTIPDDPEQTFASMGIYLFNADAMMEALQAVGNDFGKDIIPSMIAKNCNICAYDFGKMNKIEDYIVEVVDGKRTRVLVDRTRDSTYWRDVGSIDLYYEASMELVGVDPLFNLYGEKWVFRTYERPLPPTKCIIGGRIPDSLVSDGCIISGGLVQRSILSPGVVVERDVLVEDTVIFDDVIIEPGAKIRRAIIDKKARIHADASIGYDHESDRRRGCTISSNGIAVVPRGIDIGSM